MKFGPIDMAMFEPKPRTAGTGPALDGLAGIVTLVDEVDERAEIQPPARLQTTVKGGKKALLAVVIAAVLGLI